MSASMGGLARRLVSDKLLDRSQAIAAISLAAKGNIPFVTQLISSKQLDGYSIAAAATREFGLPLLDLQAYDLQRYPEKLIDSSLIKKHKVLPLLQKGKTLFLAMSDSANLIALDEIKFHTGLSIEIVVVEEDKLSNAILALEDNREHTASEFIGLGKNLLQSPGTVVTAEHQSKTTTAADEAPIVRFVNGMLLNAIKKEASDIHIEPYEKVYRIRFRMDGILQQVVSPSISFASRITSRLKIMSQMDIAERRIPQDGRIKLKLSNSRAVDFRVNTLPTLWGEKIVLRLLDPSTAQMGIDLLGFEENQKQQFLRSLQLSQGLVLVTGPTGSGKTVSLYSGLNILNTVERNISAAEDPVEINLEGINQLAVNNKVGLDFAAALRAFLRQDPDVVMVGEIRDLETAEIAIRAAQTGHLVLSTLHTTSAAETITRLQNMGIPAFNLATSLSLIIAQRLLRRLCNHCKEIMEIPEKVLIEEGFRPGMIDQLKLYKAVGCNRCNDG